MVGSLVLDECLESSDVHEVISLVRKPTSITHHKLKEVVISDFTDYSSHSSLFKGVDAAIFCIGVYTGQVADDQFKKITVDYAVQFAIELKNNSPAARYCLLSGAGADRTEKSRTSFARYKGMAENQIAATGLAFHTFRPGYIYPVSPRKSPNLMYRVSRALYPLIRLFGENMSIKSTELAKAIFKVAMQGTDKMVLENKDILACIWANSNEVAAPKAFYI